MPYFANMGTVWVNLKDGTTVAINDITAFAQILKVWKSDARVQLPYQIKDGELPHQLSERLYGTVEYWWTILLANNIWDLDEQWPRSQKQLDAYIAAKYPTNSVNDVHHYLNPQGLNADLLSLRIKLGLTDNNAVIDQAGLTAVSIGEYETAVNEVKRNIILIDPDYIEAVVKEYVNAMQEKQ